ncbi:MAG: hypothetical protein J7M24_07430, partial [Candidatus Latescibacteria bacterium]|nr:hypothetical protein [Candidatus Latescibacterota bacterium]
MRIDIRSSMETPTIGDSLTVFCTITAPKSAHTGDPYVAGKSPFLDFTAYHRELLDTASGLVETRIRYLTYALGADTLKIGPFSVDYTTASGDSGTAASNILVLPVTGVMDSKEAKPNRTPVDIPSGFPPWLFILLAALSIAALAYYFLRRRLKKQPLPAGGVQQPVDEIGEFERIRALRLYEQGKIRELYIRVSDAMRGFIQRNMELDALYETSEEILSMLSGIETDAEVVRAVRDVFVESDMVKFAKFHPAPDRSATIVDRAIIPVRKVVERIEREQLRLEDQIDAAIAAANTVSLPKT